MPCGPPWISMISGYFLLLSNPGGLTIQPSTRVPLVDAYQICSTLPSLMPSSTSLFTFVSRAIGCARLRLKRTTSGGSSGAVREGIKRSEEHTSELQSPYDLVCRLLLEKKKKNTTKYSLL